MKTATFSYGPEALRKLREAREGRKHPTSRYVEVPADIRYGEPMTDEDAEAAIQRFIDDRFPKAGLTPLDFIRTR